MLYITTTQPHNNQPSNLAMDRELEQNLAAWREQKKQEDDEDREIMEDEILKDDLEYVRTIDEIEAISYQYDIEADRIRAEEAEVEAEDEDEEAEDD